MYAADQSEDVDIEVVQGVMFGILIAAVSLSNCEYFVFYCLVFHTNTDTRDLRSYEMFLQC